MPTPLFNVSKTEVGKLSYERNAYLDALIQKGFHAVYLKATLNWSNETIGAIVDLHFNLVGKWIKTYKNEGFNGLLSNNYGNRKSDLENYSDTILSSFEQQPPLTSLEAAERIKEMTGNSRSTQKVRVFMKNMD